MTVLTVTAAYTFPPLCMDEASTGRQSGLDIGSPGWTLCSFTCSCPSVLPRAYTGCSGLEGECCEALLAEGFLCAGCWAGLWKPWGWVGERQWNQLVPNCLIILLEVETLTRTLSFLF